MMSVIFDRTGERCITVFDIFICLLNVFYSELKSSGAIVYPTFWLSCQDSYYRILLHRVFVAIEFGVLTSGLYRGL